MHKHTHTYLQVKHPSQLLSNFKKTRVYQQILVQLYQIVLKSTQQISSRNMQTDKLNWFVNVPDKIFWITSIFDYSCIFFPSLT